MENTSTGEQIFVLEGTEITVKAIYNPKALNTQRFVGTCIAREECKEDHLLPQLSVCTTCAFDIGRVRFDAPIALPIAANTPAQWGETMIACTVTTITD